MFAFSVETLNKNIREGKVRKVLEDASLEPEIGTLKKMTSN